MRWSLNTSLKSKPSEDGRVMLDSLKAAVAHTLDKKRRLGQYAIIWKNGKPVKVDAVTMGADYNKGGSV